MLYNRGVSNGLSFFSDPDCWTTETVRTPHGGRQTGWNPVLFSLYFDFSNQGLALAGPVRAMHFTLKQSTTNASIAIEYLLHVYAGLNKTLSS